MSFCLHHSKLFTWRTKFAQLPCLPLANKFPPKLSAKTQHLARQRPNKVRVPPKLYPIKKANYAQPTSNLAGQGMANGGFGVIISVE